MTNEERVLEVSKALAKGREAEILGQPDSVNGALRYVIGRAHEATEQVLGEKFKIDVEGLVGRLKVAIALPN